MTPIHRIGHELRKIVQEIKYGAHDKRAYMFYYDDFVEFVDDVEGLVGIKGGMPEKVKEDQVYKTLNGFEFYLDFKDWEGHKEYEVSLPELGEPHIVLRKGGREWKGLPSDPKDLLHILRHG